MTRLLVADKRFLNADGRRVFDGDHVFVFDGRWQVSGGSDVRTFDDRIPVVDERISSGGKHVRTEGDGAGGSSDVQFVQWERQAPGGVHAVPWDDQ